MSNNNPHKMPSENRTLIYRAAEILREYRADSREEAQPIIRIIIELEKMAPKESPKNRTAGDFLTDDVVNISKKWAQHLLAGERDA